MKVVLATRNRGKLREIGPLVAELGFDLHTIDELAPDVELREDGLTFEENALAKARQASAVARLPAIADDSGLEVDALGGAPGVHSARYAGLPSDDGRNNTKLLAALREAPTPRRARFRCVAAFVDPFGDNQGRREIVRDGFCAGQILVEPRGHDGFGYDPLFLLPELGRTMAELPLADKNAVSHRAMAFRALVAALQAAGIRGR